MTADRTSADRAGSPPRGTTANRRAAAGALPERIAFVGFGLIGASIARALRDAGSASRIAAWSPSGNGPAEGRRQGLVDVAPGTVREALDGAGLVVLAGPPLAVLAALDGMADAGHGLLHPDATITDVASTKSRIVDRAAELGLPFVGGHPMAGREMTGAAAADGELFVDRPWVLVPAASAGNPDVVRVSALAWATGARPTQLTAQAHDRAVAAISHLPLVLSAALVEAVSGEPDWPVARELAAGGWAGMTRLARGDPEMGAGIVATNGAPVVERLRTVRRVLDAWIEALEPAADAPGSDRTSQAPDPAALRDRLEAARRALDGGTG